MRTLTVDFSKAPPNLTCSDRLTGYLAETLGYCTWSVQSLPWSSYRSLVRLGRQYLTSRSGGKQPHFWGALTLNRHSKPHGHFRRISEDRKIIPIGHGAYSTQTETELDAKGLKRSLQSDSQLLKMPIRSIDVQSKRGALGWLTLGSRFRQTRFKHISSAISKKILYVRSREQCKRVCDQYVTPSIFSLPRLPCCQILLP